jgi:hypothetical protein
MGMGRPEENKYDGVFTNIQAGTAETNWQT